ncbi:MAG: sugar transferase [Capnocytophaga sp.]|nr:sugar transferase [Capnocytophaga sp.]
MNIKLIVIETSTIKEYSEEIITELISLRTKGIRIYQAEEFYEIINQRIPIVRLETKKYLGDDIFSIRMRKRYKLLKRFFDLFVVICLLPFAIPLILLGILLTKLTSKGEMFFSQIRVGENGKIFKIRKIRTMSSFNNDGGFTQANDNRITPVGKFLRLTKIDELPQLWNIFCGDMSVIGPRPERPEYVEEYVQKNPFFNLRHMIKPGVSGWAQIHLPKATPEDNLKKLEYDLFYIKRYSWKLDIKVLWETFKIVLTLNSH